MPLFRILNLYTFAQCHLFGLVSVLFCYLFGALVFVSDSSTLLLFPRTPGSNLSIITPLCYFLSVYMVLLFLSCLGKSIILLLSLWSLSCLPVLHPFLVPVTHAGPYSYLHYPASCLSSPHLVPFPPLSIKDIKASAAKPLHFQPAPAQRAWVRWKIQVGDGFRNDCNCCVAA